MTRYWVEFYAINTDEWYRPKFSKPCLPDFKTKNEAIIALKGWLGTEFCNPAYRSRYRIVSDDLEEESPVLLIELN